MTDERATGKRGHSRHKVGDPLPAVLVLRDLGQLLGLGYTQTWQLERRGEFEPFELKPRIGRKARYSGKKVQAWLDGEDPDDAEPIRFFPRGRKAR